MSTPDEQGSDPLGQRLLDRVEVLTTLVGLATSTVALAFGWPVALGWAGGWVACQLNVGVLRRMMATMIGSGAGRGLATLALVLKMTVLLVGTWLLLTRTPAHPLAFAGGFGVTVAGLVVGSVICAPRLAPRLPEEEPSGDEESRAQAADSASEVEPKH